MEKYRLFHCKQDAMLQNGHFISTFSLLLASVEDIDLANGQQIEEEKLKKGEKKLRLLSASIKFLYYTMGHMDTLAGVRYFTTWRTDVT